MIIPRFSLITLSLNYVKLVKITLIGIRFPLRKTLTPLEEAATSYARRERRATVSGSRLVMLNLGWKKRHISGVLFSGKTQSIQQFTPINRFHEIRKRVSLNNRAEIHSTTLLHNFWNGSHAIPLQIPFFSPKYNTIEMYFF